MKEFNIETFKPCIITRIGNDIDMIRIIYHKYGFKQGTLTTYRLAKISLYRFIYKHSSFIRKRFQQQFKPEDQWMFVAFDMLMRNKPFEVQDILAIMPEEKRAEWNKTAIESIRKILKEENITDEEQIKRLYKSFGLEYNTENEL